MEKKILLVVNPVAGKGTTSKDINQIKENFEMSGFEVETKLTTLDNSAEKIVEKSDSKEDIIVAIGGDGTLNGVVNGVTKSKKNVKLGFIPFGTTNDFARTLKIPTDRFFLSKNISGTVYQSDARPSDTGNPAWLYPRLSFLPGRYDLPPYQRKRRRETESMCKRTAACHRIR